MKILIGHMATTKVWPRFVMAQRWQTIIGQPPNAVHVIVSETPANKFADWDTIVEPRGESGGLFNLSAMRNRIRELADAEGFDGFMIVESDFVVLRWPSVLPPLWAIPLAIYDNVGAITLQNIEDHHVELFRNQRGWEILGHRPLIPVHCVIVSRPAFDRAVWDERFVGCGFDDWDFNNTMHNSCGPFSHTDACLVHRWHVGTGDTPRQENLKLYESKWGKINPTRI